MIVGAGGAAVTARSHPGMLLITPELDGELLRLTAPGMPELTVKTPREGELATVNVGGNDLLATLAGEEADAWVGAVTREPSRLVYLDDPARRPVTRLNGRPEDRVSLADGYPLLLTSEDSLAALNALIAAGWQHHEGPVPMRRFRPNVVVAGAGPWAEDGWRLLRIGDVTFRAAKLSDRCVMTTLDPDTAAKGKEPLRTLARHRRWDGKVWFGVNLIPDAPRPGDVIGDGDPVRILS